MSGLLASKGMNSKVAALFGGGSNRPRESSAATKETRAEDTDDSDSDDLDLVGHGKQQRDQRISELDVDEDEDDSSGDDDEGEEAGASPSAVSNSTGTPTKKMKKMKKASAEDDAARIARTIFVGNLPIDTKPKAVRKHFATYGPLEAVRLRSAAAANPKMSQRAAIITGELSGDAVAAYVVFKHDAGAAAAKAANGSLAFGRHLRIDAASRPGESSAATKLHDARTSVFLGNLPHTVSEETLWELFATCGAISYVRLIREPRTQLGKGFGYIGFQEAGSVERALALHGAKVAGRPEEGEGGDNGTEGKPRPIRVFRCSTNKSHARLADHSTEGSMGASRKPGAKRASKEAEHSADGEGDGSGQRKGVGWQQRVRRRLQKKLESRVKQHKGGDAGKESGGADKKSGMGKKAMAKLESAIAKTRSVLKGGGRTKTTAKARRETKAKANAKRERSKMLSGKKRPMKTSGFGAKGGSGKGGGGSRNRK